MPTTHIAIVLGGVAPAQVKEAGEFAAAVLQRNIAVGAIVLLVCAVVALVFWIRAKDKEIAKLQDARVEDGRMHNAAMADRAADVAEEFNAQRDKLVELIVQQTKNQEQIRAALETFATTGQETKSDIRQILDEVRRNIGGGR